MRRAHFFVPGFQDEQNLQDNPANPVHLVIL